MAHAAPFTLAILREATAISPRRSTASDGTVGDARHRGEISDHNPDSTGMTHASDVTHDVSGATAAERFDAHAHGEIIRARCKVGTERRVKYLVSHDFRNRTDIIASPNSGWLWRRKASNDHASHLHISILYDDWVEQSTAPIFSGAVVNPSPDPVIVSISISGGGDDEEDLMIEQPGKNPDPNRTASHRLDRNSRVIVSYNLGALGGDREFYPGHVSPRVRDLGFTGPILGWFATKDGRGIKVEEALGDGSAADHYYEFT